MKTRRYSFFIIFLISLVIPIWTRPTAPPKVSEESNSDTGISQKKRPKIEETHKCYFSVPRISDFEKIARDSLSRVSGECSGEVKQWENYRDSFKGDKFGAMNEFDMLAARGAAEYIDFYDSTKENEAKNRFVCDKHYKELVSEWDLNGHLRRKRIDQNPSKFRHQFHCSMPNSIGGHDGKIPIAISGTTLTRDEAEGVLIEKGIHVHFGIPICKLHKDQVWEWRTLQRAKSSSIACRLRSAVSSLTTCDADIACQSSSSQNENVEATFGDENAHADNSKLKQQIIEQSKAKFWEWVDSLALPFINSRKPFSDLTPRSKRRKSLSTRTLIDRTFEMISPGHSEDLKHLTLDSETDEWYTNRAEMFEDLMLTIANEFRLGETRKERVSVLSIVAGTMNYQTILKYIPGLSKSRYNEARKYSFSLSRPGFESKKRQKYDPELVAEFVDFLTSPLVRTDLPYGRRKLKKSDGTIIDVPDTLRIVRSVEIIDMFVNYKSEEGTNEKMLSRASMYKILSACKATTRRAMECVDYFVAEASDSFDRLAEIIDELSKEGYIDDKTANGLKIRFSNIKLYLKSDYKLHVKPRSRVSDHCIQYALSDPKDKRFNVSCNEGPESHSHDLFCDRCELMRMTFDDTLEIVTSLINAADAKTLKKTDVENKKAKWTLQEYSNDIGEAKRNVENLKKHVLRDRHLHARRSIIVDNLKKGHALLTLDWAQKVLPKQSREPQNDYYGKSGISVHATHVLSIDGDGAFKQHNLIHVFEQEMQDSPTVLMIIKHVLKELKLVGITNVHIRTDNAGCYHSTATIVSLPGIAKSVGVSIDTITFSEPQGGKGAADRAVNEAKTKIRTFIASKHNAETPQQIFEGLTTGRIPKAMSVYLMTIDIDTLKLSNSKLTGISGFYDFEFNGFHMTVRKYGGIGKGWKVDTSRHEKTTGTYKIKMSGGIFPGKDDDKFWKKMATNPDSDGQQDSSSMPVVETSIDVDEENPKPTKNVVFECPIDGCVSNFLKMGNLQRHLEIGKHQMHAERETMLDSAMDRYSNNLEGWGDEVSAVLKDAIGSIRTDSIFTNPVGWANPERKCHTKYTAKAVNFVKDQIDHAINTKSKVLPKQIAKNMKEKKNVDGITPFFRNDETLNYKQILAIYNKMGTKRRQIQDRNTQVVSNRIAAATTPTTLATVRTTAKTFSRPKRSNDVEDEIVEALVTELNKLECDDYEDIYDNHASHDTHYDNVMSQLQPELDKIFDNVE